MELIKKIISFGFVFLFSFSCNTTEPPNNQQIKLTVEDVSCTEAWLKLELTNTTLPAQINLFIDEKLKNNLTITANDTVLYVDSLLPNKTYKFHSVIHPINQSENKSNVVTVQTMDTTSHNFTFETFTFGGDAGSSYLSDVAIINENSIWAVGAIYTKDSLGNYDPNAFNAVHWDGNEWKLKRIQFFTICGQSSISSYPAKTIFAINENEIWIAMDGDQLVKLENGIQTKAICLPWSFSINKIWGMSSENLFVVGNNGNIAHYQNGTWSKIESGTSLRLLDIYGTPDGKNIWACGWDNATGNSVILEIKNDRAEIIYHSTEKNIPAYFGKLDALWSAGSEFILGGSLVFRHSLYNKNNVETEFVPITDGSELFMPGNFIWALRGSEKNNVFIAGDNGMVWHYNGVSWYKILETYSEQFDRRIFGLAVHQNIMASVGWKNSSAWIAIGKK